MTLALTLLFTLNLYRNLRHEEAQEAQLARSLWHAAYIILTRIRDFFSVVGQLSGAFRHETVTLPVEAGFSSR